jgi:tetratricopeptide (TPR) repeat protein
MRMTPFYAIASLAASLSLAAASDTPPVPAPKKEEPKKEEKSPAREKLEAGQALRKSRKYEEALSRLREAKELKSDPKLESQILYETGETHFLRGQDASEGKLPGVEPEPALRQAANLFEVLLRSYPGEEKASEAAYRLGSTYVLLDDFPKAITSYQKVFDDYPASTDRLWSLIRIGLCQAGLDRPGEAKATLKRVLNEFPDRTAEVQRARKYLSELSVVGITAPRIAASRWILGMVSPEGVKGFQGEVVTLFFFATWCSNCRKELPHLRAMMKKLSPRGVVFLGIANPDDPMNTQAVEPYVEENKLEFLDVALDPGEASWGPYRVAGFPAAVLIDRKGTIRWRGHPAYLPGPLIEKLLAEK